MTKGASAPFVLPVIADQIRNGFRKLIAFHDFFHETGKSRLNLHVDARSRAPSRALRPSDGHTDLFKSRLLGKSSSDQQTKSAVPTVRTESRCQKISYSAILIKSAFFSSAEFADFRNFT